MRIKDLPDELNLYIYSFVDDFEAYFKEKVLTELQERIRNDLLKRVFSLLSQLKIQEAYSFIMNEDEFNYHLMHQDPTFCHFDKKWFGNMVRKNKYLYK